MRMLAICILMHCIAAVPAAANERQEAKRLLDAVRASEPLVMAAIQTRDEPELRRQALELRTAISKQGPKASSSDRFDPCTRAAVELSSLADWMVMVNAGGLDARKLAGMKSIYSRWSSEITGCETALADKKRRELVLDLNR